MTGTWPHPVPTSPATISDGDAILPFLATPEATHAGGCLESPLSRSPPRLSGPCCPVSASLHCSPAALSMLALIAALLCWAPTQEGLRLALPPASTALLHGVPARTLHRAPDGAGASVPLCQRAACCTFLGAHGCFSPVCYSPTWLPPQLWNLLKDCRL